MSWIGANKLSVERLTVKIKNLPPALSGTKIVHLTDLHYDGLRLPETLLMKTIEVNNEENPDIILLTGDYITDDPTPIHDLVLRLKHLRSKKGIYACLGNHDIYYPQAREIVTKAFTGIGIKVLWNAIAFPLGAGLPIVGLADFWSREFKPEPVFSQLNPNTPRIVLSHQPDTAQILQQWRVDLQLSGHTHGGQMVIPGLGSAPTLIHKLRHYTPAKLHFLIPYLKESLRVAKHWEWALGLHQVGKNLLYVNRGLGTYHPGRFCCPPELTVISLRIQNE
ncbi:MAG: metallophosphoesterase [Gomphosphaeria aponina SAG 52.96 = DSM 107014]|uniref:Metallophosphoesterase n=1 Tax=Gomphosphaeria aponina SAG 52.96 = DSM 107014 TaxID=1521640 RepID=A0A941GV45_9CHRO|nr:metallophosphoesterase [Gomphosphaeria aponina SAG 52.96 = DSM 107014]